MARQSEFDAVLEKLDADIARLEETKALLLAARNQANPLVRKTRTRKKKAENQDI